MGWCPRACGKLPFGTVLYYLTLREHMNLACSHDPTVHLAFSFSDFVCTKLIASGCGQDLATKVYIFLLWSKIIALILEQNPEFGRARRTSNSKCFSALEGTVYFLCSPNHCSSILGVVYFESFVWNMLTLHARY
jgi:hypothetical protein